jgi:D-glycero-D-manno-heptose 1,7-bisphosphate phosphatase
MPANRLVVLDRDGVINEDSPDSIRTLAQWRPLPGSVEAIARLSQAGWTVAVATNQSGIGRGYLSMATLDSIHSALLSAVQAIGGSIAIVAFCPHTPTDGCTCRKPATGLLTRIEEATGLSARGAPFVGDSPGDMGAALAHGCLPMLVRTGNGLGWEAEARRLGVTRVFDDLASAADWLLTA